MATIIQYRDDKPARNLYPTRIVSPTRPSSCCMTHMAVIGPEHEEWRWVFQYKRCITCGFSVRCIVREIPDATLVAEVRNTLATGFVRGWAS